MTLEQGNRGTSVKNNWTDRMIYEIIGDAVHKSLKQTDQPINSFGEI